jgi:hypothetical protein
MLRTKVIRGIMMTQLGHGGKGLVLLLYLVAGVLLVFPSLTLAQEVDFERIWDHPMDKYQYVVSTGDLNADGIPDLVALGAVFLGNGYGGFGAPIAYSLPELDFRSVAVGDFNLDGKDDVVILNPNDDHAGIYIGDGSGSVRLSQPPITVGDYPVSVAVGDFNRDGVPDIVVANYTSSDVTILTGLGDGTYDITSTHYIGNNPSHVTVSDFNGDGMLDLVVTKPYADAIAILIGDGSGSFGTYRDFSTGDYPYSVAVGDFNMDGKQDVVTANFYSGNVSILIGNGNGTFGPFKNFSSGNYPTSVAAGDFNRNGILDLAVTNYSGGISSTVSILTGKGDGSFELAVELPAGNGPTHVTTEDLNRDGKTDLFVTNLDGLSIFENRTSISPLQGIQYYRKDFDTSESPVERVGPYSVSIGDLDRDGLPDLATAIHGGDKISIFRTIGGIWGSRTDLNTMPGGDPQSIAGGDFNRDGKPDLVVANFESDNISVFFGDGNGNLGQPSNFAVGDGPIFVAVEDLNRDGILDVITTNDNSLDVSILIGEDGGTFGAPTHISTGDGNPLSVAPGDFNSDGKPDLAIAKSALSENIFILTGLGDGSFEPGDEFSVEAFPRSIAAGDFNRDGIPDLVTTTPGSNSISTIFGNGDGSFGSYNSYPVGENPRSIAVGDFNWDGIPDLVTANFDSNDISMLLGDDYGNFGQDANFAVGDMPVFVSVGDFNLDSRDDLAVATVLNDSITVLLNPTFTNADDDLDGIVPKCDLQPDVYSNDFSDEQWGGYTRGHIESRGDVTLLIADKPIDAPKLGVTVEVDPYMVFGPQPATLICDNNPGVFVDVHSGEVRLICGSVTIDVATGLSALRFTVNGQPARVDVTGGNGVTYDAGLLTAHPDNSGVLHVLIGEQSIPLEPGKTLNTNYSFIGFLPPLENPPVINTAKAGRTIPVKWQLLGADGNYISDLSAVTDIGLQEAPCGGTSENPVYETDTSGSSGLRYDMETNQFIYTWKTEKDMTGCYSLILELYGLDRHEAYFELR